MALSGNNYVFAGNSLWRISEEFSHVEGDAIAGIHYKIAVITLVERLSKVIFTLKPKGCKASDIELAMNRWLQVIPINLFDSITFDCGERIF